MQSPKSPVVPAAVATAAIAAALVLAGTGWLGRSPAGAAAAALPNDDKTILHVLNRIAFGPRPGDVERVKALGLQRYIDEQLRPERIADTSMPARLSALATLGLSNREIAQTYELPQLQARQEKKR